MKYRVRSATGLPGFLFGELWFWGIVIGPVKVGRLYWRKEPPDGPIQLRHHGWGIWRRAES